MKMNTYLISLIGSINGTAAFLAVCFGCVVALKWVVSAFAGEYDETLRARAKIKKWEIVAFFVFCGIATVFPSANQLLKASLMTNDSALMQKLERTLEVLDK